MERKKNTWNVTLQREDGEIVQHPFSAFWDPAQEGCNEAVGDAAKAAAYWQSHKQFHFAPLAVALVA